MSNATTFEGEEQVGLLRLDEDIDTRDSIDSHEELRWRKIRIIPVHHYSLWQRWTKLFIVLPFIISISILFVNISILSDNHPPESFLPQLRPEGDYILSPVWDFGAAPKTREYTWVIQDHTLNPDGVYRPMTLINSTFPGPLIECNEGDEIIVHVLNRALNATSIHWHGMFQNNTNWMDGTVGLTQCPIAPGQSFTYRFNVSNQAGTYYYHSHMSMQASDGLVGPLIIHARHGKEKALQKIPYDQDRVVLLSDHYYDLSADLLMQYLAPGNENDEPVPPSALINGRNKRNCSDLPYRNCSSTYISRALFDLSAHSSTRLRVINAGAFAEFSLQIDEHQFQVTEVDGTDVFPQSIHRLNINPAQRYSIILTPPGQTNKGLYWMRARMITHCFAYEEPELQEEVWGVIRYVGQEQKHEVAESKIEMPLPQTKDWPEAIEVECRDLNTSALEPVIPIAAPKKVDHLVYLRSSFQIRDWRLSRGFLNDSSFHINVTSPILNTFFDSYGPESAINLTNGINDALFNPETQLIYQTTGTPVIDILIQNFDDNVHPFHLHGYKFWVLAQGHGYPPENYRRNLNLTNPLRRDTTSVEAFGWTLFRFIADNPGVWPFHCHISWHSERLMMTFVTRVEEIVKWKDSDDVRKVQELCHADGVEKGMGPDDSIWIGNWD